MKKYSLIILMFIIDLLFGQINYEPGKISLKLRQPDIVSIQQNQVINASLELQTVFQKYQPISTEKVKNAGPHTRGWYRIKYPLNAPLLDILNAIKECPDIKNVTLNHYGILAGIPDDPLWTDQWALQKIEMPDVWDVALPDESILIGVMDTGLDYTHVDLIDNIWQNLGEDDDGDGHTLEWNGANWILDPGDKNNGTDSDGNGYPDDLVGWNFIFDNNNPQENGLSHGTRVSGVIAAKTFNAKGLAGIAGGWENQTGVRIIGLSIAEPPHGHWVQQRAMDAILYLKWLRDQGHIVIANMSFQTIGVDDEPLPDFADAILDAKDAGVIMVSAAGNTSDNPHSPYQQPAVETLPIPARYEGVLAIGASHDGATLQDEFRSTYSLYDVGDSSYRAENPQKLLTVSPVDKIPQVLNVVTTYPGNQYYYNFHGTSAACPIAVGVAALMLSNNPNLNSTDISNIFASTAEKIGPYIYNGNPGRTDEVSYGRINAEKAIKHPAVRGYGHFSSNFTLSSNITISGDLIVDQGATLVISKGVTLTFEANSDAQNEGNYANLAELIVKGKIIFNGTTAEPIVFRSNSGAADSWGGIRFEDESDDNSIIDHCIIQDAKIGIQIIRSNPEISDNTINNNLFGLFLNYSTAPVINNSISENLSTGLLIYNSNNFENDMIVESNTIDQNGGRGVYSTNSSPIFKKNLINSNTLHGIEGTNQFNAIIGTEPTGQSYIQYNGQRGLSISNQSVPFLGSELVPGLNCIQANNSFEFYYAGGGECLAELNYWGSPYPDPAEFFTSGSSVIDYDPWLEEYPTENRMLSEVSGRAKPESSVTDSMGLGIRNLIQFYFRGEYENVISTALRLINANPNNKNLSNIIGLMWRSYLKLGRINEFVISLKYFIEQYSHLRIGGWARQALASILASNGDYTSAIQYLQTAGNLFPSSDLEQTALYQQFLIYLIDLKNSPSAQIILDTLIQKYPGEPMTQNAAELFNYLKQTPPGNTKNLSNVNSGKITVKTSKLYQNYPNPFNPSTTISFYLPEAENVMLEIFDLTGRKIRTLLRENRESGSHQIVWNGNNENDNPVASGIYIYCLKAGGFEMSRKMLLVR